MFRRLLILVLTCLLPSMAMARANPEPWISALGSVPIQDGGRVMPLDTYARNLAAQLTGRERWSATGGPEAFAGRHPVQLWCDLMFAGPEFLHRPLLLVDNVPFKEAVGLDGSRRFFTPMEIGNCSKIGQLISEYESAREANAKAQPTKNQRIAQDLQSALNRLSAFMQHEPLPLIPRGAGKAYLRVGLGASEPGAETVAVAMAKLRDAYSKGQGLDEAVAGLRAAIDAAGASDPAAANVPLELFYNTYHPWLYAAYGYTAALIALGISRLAWRRGLMIIGIVASCLGVLAHVGGLVLRVKILDRAPVSNTYEALLWMGLVGIAVALIAQLINRRAYYFAAGLGVALLSVLFANLVPLESQTNSLPAVLRSNYWLIIHVLTITSSYGVLAVASILGHVYLVKQVLLGKRGGAEAPTRLAHPIIVQTYRSMQLGLVLLTAGTILGGVWAADSWGRFWGWDPKETWALISIIVYFIILHARYLRWIQDFGMAAWAVLAFASIVWTFYGVNYLMASGLHSYGFGAGGGTWVGAWLGIEIIFVGICVLKQRALTQGGGTLAPAGTPPAGRSAHA